jgi:hypothetical protein
MHTKQIQIPVAGRRRGRYSEAFKTQVVTAARQPGVSTAAGRAGQRIERQPAAPLDFRVRSATPESVIHIEPQRAGTTVFDSALARVVHFFGAAHPHTAYLLNSTLPSTFSVIGDPRLNEINGLRWFLC